jgi:hypothetical protein
MSVVFHCCYAAVGDPEVYSREREFSRIRSNALEQWVVLCQYKVTFCRDGFAGVCAPCIVAIGCQRPWLSYNKN